MNSRVAEAGSPRPSVQFSLMFLLDTNTLIYFFKGIGKVADRLLATAPSALGRLRPFALSGLQRRVDVLDKLDAGLFEMAVEVLDVGLVEVDLGNGRGDVTASQYAKPLTLGDQRRYFLKLL